MKPLSPLPLFEQFLNQQEDQAPENEKLTLGNRQLQGVRVTSETKFSGSGTAMSPVGKVDWLPRGEYEIENVDADYVRVVNPQGRYWITRYDLEEINSKIQDGVLDTNPPFNAETPSDAVRTSDQ